MRMEKPEIKERSMKWVTRYDRQAERKFLFYAAMIMLAIWGSTKIMGV